MSRKGQGKIKVRSRQDQGKAKARSRRGQGKVKVRSKLPKNNLKRSYNLIGSDTIEINLVSNTTTDPIQCRCSCQKYSVFTPNILGWGHKNVYVYVMVFGGYEKNENVSDHKLFWDKKCQGENKYFSSQTKLMVMVLLSFC